VPYRFVDDEWIRMGDTVWTAASAEPTRCIRFLQNGVNTRWDVVVRNETGRTPIYFSEVWDEERHYSIRSAPYFLSRATQAARENWIPIATILTILLGGSTAFALLHSRNREKATILADIKEELNKARDMQRSLFPSRKLRNDDLEITGVCHSMQECGGDYYDYFEMRDGSVLFTVADVAGHGYAAALRMSSIHYHLHSGELSVPDPAHILSQLNRNLAAAGRPSEFVTHFLARVSADGRRLWYASAGHPGAVLVRGDGRIETLDSTGLPLGIMPDAEYEQRSVELGPLDLVVAFTDGLLEATNHRDEEYGEERVIDVLSRYNRKNLDAIISALFESVTGFQGRIAQLDDIAIIAARVASS
ncbi:MAG: serine/threonine-protein phosphatase, partial [Gemmatimonadetes bacterium]|nr:serine/threonine-protein phosphatase [Gemmatimonadota bacterium]